MDVARQAKQSRHAARGRAQVADDERLRSAAPSTPAPVAGLVYSESSLRRIQRKLAVGAANDPCEHEADAVARQVVEALRAGGGHRHDEQDPEAPAPVGVLRSLATTTPQTETIGADGGALDSSSEALLRRARGGGKALDTDTRSKVEPVLGADLSGVRLHSGPESTALNEHMQANAFTVGNDVFFRGATPSARDSRGLELLAHELTHTVQQGASPRTAQRTLATAEPSVQRIFGFGKKKKDDGSAPVGSGGTAPTAPVPAPAPDKVEAALDKFAKRDGKKVVAAINAYKKRSEKSEEHEIGHGVSVSGKMDVAGQAGAYAGAEIRELQDAYAVLVEAGVVVGASLKLEGELKKKFGKLAVKAKGTFSAFAGAMVKAFGSVEFGRKGVSMEGSVKALAGVESVQNGQLQFSVGDFGAKVEAEARELAGAEFEAEGTFALKKDEIALGGKFSAFAGAKVDGKVKAAGTLYGREAASLTLTGTASAGVGGSGGAKFSFKRGVLRINLKGHVSLGLGAGGGSEVATDFKPIAVWIIRRAYRTYWSNNKDEADKVLANPDSVKPDLIADLEKYAAFKRQQLSLGKADNYVKEEKIQQYVNKHVPRAMVKKSGNAAAVDKMIKEAIEEAFTEGTEKTVEVTVTDGKVKVTKSKPADDYAKGKRVVTSEKTGKGLSGITTSSKG